MSRCRKTPYFDRNALKATSCGMLLLTARPSLLANQSLHMIGSPGGRAMKAEPIRVSPRAKPVGIWIRVSTEDQARGESPEHHERSARLYDIKWPQRLRAKRPRHNSVDHEL